MSPGRDGESIGCVGCPVGSFANLCRVTSTGIERNHLVVWNVLMLMRMARSRRKRPREDSPILLESHAFKDIA